MAAMIDALLSPLKAATDTAKSLIEVRDAVKWGEISADLYAQIYAAYQGAIAAQHQQAAMLEENGELRKKVAQLEGWEAEKKRYVLCRIPPGITVYALRPDDTDGEPPHYLCANCYQRGQKRFLQPVGSTILRCHECGSDLIREEDGGRRQSYRSAPIEDPARGW